MTNDQINETGDESVPKDRKRECVLPGTETLILLLNVHLTIEHSNVQICTNTPQSL